MYTTLLIEYANPLDMADSIVVDFKLRDHSFMARWIERVETAKSQYQIDQPDRFYGFGSIESQTANALKLINDCAKSINEISPLITRFLTNVEDQDTLNYLHHVFEVHHGLLDKQNDESNLRYLLANLNILVHRCEAMALGANPRHVITWYGLPKDKFLNINDYKLFTDEWEVGTVFLNYAEIGKTLEDFAMNNDNYISREAFQPFKHYSADFNVKFWATTPLHVKSKRDRIEAYYRDNRDFFGPWNVNFVNGSIPLADIVNQIDLKEIETRQYVKSVNFK